MKPPTTCPMIPPRGSKSDDSYRDGDADPRDTFHNCKKIRGSKSDDSYRDGDAIQVTVSTFHNCNKIQGSRSDDSYRDGDADPHGPCDCCYF